MYVLSEVDLCELDHSIPMVFRFGENVLGLNSWKAQTFNMDTNEIETISNVPVFEIAKMSPMTTVNGKHGAGYSTLKVLDSSMMAVGNVIRVGNLVFRVQAIEPSSHNLTLDRKIENDIDDQTIVLYVETPEFLGVYKAEVPMARLGRFVITLTDTAGIVNPIENTVEVVVSLDSTVSSNGRVSTIRGGTIS